MKKMSKDIERIMKIQRKLNREAFHLCVSTNLEDECRWVLFLYMPNTKDYFSSYNRPILDSRRSSVDELEEYLKKYDGIERWSE